MKEKKADTPSWAVGCAIILLLAFITALIYFLWWAITSSWLGYGLGACLLLVCLITVVRKFLTKRKRQHKLPEQFIGPSTASPYTPNVLLPHSSASAPIPAFDSYDFAPKYYLNSEQVAALVADGMIVNGNCGGLLVGRAHSQGGVPVMRKQAGGRYEVWAEFEGYEYIVNPGAVICFSKECESTNQYQIDKKPLFSEYIPEQGITIIDVRADNHPLGTKYLILDALPNFFVVNKFSTQIRLRELEEMNRMVTYEQYILAMEKNAGN
ncbi:MAG: hypothetical protein ACRYFX_09930 [Janthinobacterium lividum]